jgi:DNA-binding XRE family transcriptional regulator
MQKMSAELKTWCEPSENRQLDDAAEAKLIAAIVRVTRAALALSQEEFARETGLSKRTIINIELCRVVPSAETTRILKNYLAACNFSVRYSSSDLAIEFANFRVNF